VKIEVQKERTPSLTPPPPISKAEDQAARQEVRDRLRSKKPVSKPASTPAIRTPRPTRRGGAKSNAERLHAALTANDSDGDGHEDNPGADLDDADEAAEPEDNRSLDIYVYIEVKGAKGKVEYEQRGPATHELLGGYQHFLKAIAGRDGANVATNRLSNVAWALMKPVKPSLLALNSKKGYEAMVSAVFKTPAVVYAQIRVYMKIKKARKTDVRDLFSWSCRC
jgi:hypothetical protein